MISESSTASLSKSQGEIMIPGEIKPDSDTNDELRLTEQVVSTYGLRRWAEEFTLMTAGYRDHIDPNDAANPEVPFNTVTVAIMAEARARVLRRTSGSESGEEIQIHVGGEVRANTQTFIQVAARIYASHGFRVHLRREVQTSPIWYSSFGVFYEEYEGGDNFTASHSPYFKLGWKVMDRQGKQLTEEEEEIISEVRRIVAERATIRLAPWRSSLRISSDFDVDETYSEYQRTVLGPEAFTTISESAQGGFRCAASPLGGSMGATSKRIFRHLEIPTEALNYFLDSEDSRFHRVGEIGNHNFGADVGKLEVCANTGAPDKLLSGEAHLVLLWDPDGDRLNIITTAPAELQQRAIDFGVNIGPSNGQRMVVYLTPNQLYLLVTDYRINLLRANGLLEKYDWFVGTTFPTAMAIEELALQEGVPTIRVPVGFRNLGELCQTVEKELGAEQTVTTLTGQHIRLGPAPRALLLCEESGGATLGGPDLMRSKSGAQALLALREKDGLQMSLIAWAMAASLHRSGVSLAEQYCDVISRRKIQYRYNERFDIPLYNESLTGSELQRAKAEGIQKRDRAVAFFREAATAFAAGQRSESSVRDQLLAANPVAARDAVPPIKHAAWIGDGSLFDMVGARLIIRASGTDALLRYYIEATNRESLGALQQFVAGLRF
jgi:phosphomannomutase